MPVRTRLDRELVRRGLSPSREQAIAAITERRVRVGGQQALKPARGVAANEPIDVSAGDEPGYASRGAYKLAGALADFASADPPLRVKGRRCLDAGASTGGFTDVLLREGATSVVAVDVGYGQLIWRLQNDARVKVIDRTNVRHLTPEVIGGQVELLVADLSFISLRLVLPALAGCVVPTGDLVVLVKPQFEVGRALVGKGGVVRDLAAHESAIRGVTAAAAAVGLGVRGLSRSTLPGPAGNLEYVLWLAESGSLLSDDAIERAVHTQNRPDAVTEGSP